MDESRAERLSAESAEIDEQRAFEKALEAEARLQQLARNMEPGDAPRVLAQKRLVEAYTRLARAGGSCVGIQHEINQLEREAGIPPRLSGLSIGNG